jgi:uncharacterized protein (TIGR02117 family)
MTARRCPGPSAITPVLILVALWAGCAAPMRGAGPSREVEPGPAIYVVDHGLHTGLVVRRADVPADLWSERQDLADAEYLEIGWGDREFYQAPKATLGLALKALFWPTSSVIHVVAFDQPPDIMFLGREIVRIRVSAPEMAELSRFVADTYARDTLGRVIPLGPGLYGASRFYLARGQYSLLNTCNHWTARALRAAGCSTTPWYAFTAGHVMEEAWKCKRSLSGDESAVLLHRVPPVAKNTNAG